MVTDKTYFIECPLVAASSVDIINCFNDLGAIILNNINGGTSPYSFQWLYNNLYLPDTLFYIDSLSSGTYQAIITDSIGCSDTVLENLISPALLEVNYIQKQDVSIGRFGWKAGEPNLRQQASAAFNIDLGISGPLSKSHWGDCTTFQQKCRNAPNGNTPEQNNLEISLKSMDKLVFYSQNLAVPARRNLGNKQVLAGKKLFYETGCISCHRPKFVTKILPNQPEQSFQLIWPYTDLLLHNMGEGLADNRPEGEANGFEWRTAPLWGIGLTKIVSGHTEFLHDGRARNLLEAILWHGGEAENSKKKVLTFDKEERQALLSFLNSL